MHRNSTEHNRAVKANFYTRSELDSKCTTIPQNQMNCLLLWLLLLVFVLSVASLHVFKPLVVLSRPNFQHKPNKYHRLAAPLRRRGSSKLFGIEDFDSAKGQYYAQKPLAYTPQSMYEVNRRFRLSSRDVQRIKETHSKGSVGVVISLDTALLDLTQLFGYAYAMFSEDLDDRVPNPATIRDLVGCTFRDYAIALGWSFPTDDLPLQEEKLFACVDYLLDKVPFEVQPGCVELVNSVLEQGNDIIVVTSLPRPLALKVLGKSQLSQLFEGRVNPDHLLTYNPPPPPDDLQESRLDNYGDRYMNKRFLQICGIFKKPPVLCVLIDGNRRHILSAKRNGLSCIALSGYAEYTQDLSSADSIAANLLSIKMNELNKLVERAAVNADGPAPALAAVPEIKKRKQKLAVLTLEPPDPSKQALQKATRRIKPTTPPKKEIRVTQGTKDPVYKAIAAPAEDEYHYDVFDDEDDFDLARYALYERMEDEDDE